MSVSAVGIAWYKKEDYERLLALFTDRDELHSTWEEWLKAATRLMNQLRRDGHVVRKIYIDPDTFPSWCSDRGLSIDAKARIRFASEAVARNDRN